MFSIYFYLFNIQKLNFDAESAIKNFTSFADEVICSTLSYQKEDCDILHSFEKQYPNFKVVETDISLSNNRFDGLLKTAALEKCSQPIRIIADADERFPLSQLRYWKYYGNILSNPILNGNIDGFLIPVIDLWGNKQYIRKNVQIGQKFRMHKDTIKYRNVLPQADLGNGFFRTDMSDSTEPLTEKMELGRFMQLPIDLSPINASKLKDYIYVVHEGYLNLNRRELVNKWWKPHWEARSNHEENVITDKYILEKEEVIEHNLTLE